MKGCLVNRHKQLAEAFQDLCREYEDSLLHPTIQKWRGSSVIKKPHLIWPDLQRIMAEMELIALQFYGADLGDSVKLNGKRYGGAVAEIESVEAPPSHRNGVTRLGEKPRIRVISPKGRRHIVIGGHLWELIGRSE